MAGAEGIEPSSVVLETIILPIYEAPIYLVKTYYYIINVSSYSRRIKFTHKEEKIIITNSNFLKLY